MRDVLLAILLLFGLLMMFLIRPILLPLSILVMIVFYYRNNLNHILTEIVLFAALLSIVYITVSNKAIFVIITAPFSNFKIFWTVLPMLAAWIVLEVYFSRHEDENIGWNTAICNGLMLFWAGLNILFSMTTSRYVFQKFIMMSIIIGYAIFLVYISFTHRYSQKATFRFASTNIVYYFGILGILYAYDVILPTARSILSSVVLLCMILLTIRILKKMVHNLIADE